MESKTQPELQAKIDRLPREHMPLPYRVRLQDKKGTCTTTHYVRASSPHRAVLTAIKVEWFVYRRRESKAGRARPYGWQREDLNEYGILPSRFQR